MYLFKQGEETMQRSYRVGSGREPPLSVSCSASRLYQISLLAPPQRVNESPEIDKLVFVCLRSAIWPICSPSRLVQKYTHLTVLDLSGSSAVLHLDALRPAA